MADVVIPVSKIKRPRPVPKGRPVDPVAREEIARLLEGASLDREYLIENLHLIQDRFGHISAAHLNALAEAMKLAQAEVYGCVLYHFDVVKEGETAPAITVRVCDTLSCAMAGAQDLLDKLPKLLGPNVRVIPAPCIGRCDQAPAVCIGQNAFGHAKADDVAKCVKEGKTKAPVSRTHHFDDYVSQGGYKTWVECVKGQRDVESVIKTMEDAGLRGLGGAGFPTGRKWRIVRAEPAPRLMAVNIDEGEPGTFKDRHYLERDPHRFLEGMLIAAWAVGIDDIYVYLRDEYHAASAGARDRRAESDPPAKLPKIHLHGVAPAPRRRSAMITDRSKASAVCPPSSPYVRRSALRPSARAQHGNAAWARDLSERPMVPSRAPWAAAPPPVSAA